jgi:beta-N-acetylhexosaminidase
VAGCIKHIPGHGRANADSHLALPRVDAPRAALEQDWAPFRALADAPSAMTAHVLYTALDAERCATLSPVVVGEVIRGAIGFEGLLFSDDLDMQALARSAGADAAPLSLEERARQAFAAGCEVVLQCNGKLADMQEVAQAAPALSGEAWRRAQALEAIAKADSVWDQAWALARIDRIRARAAAAV